MNNIIGEAIGRAAAGVTGMTAMYLPEGVDYDFAAAIVAAANKARTRANNGSLTPSYAILVTSSLQREKVDDCPVVTSNESLMYRKDDRLVVLYNSPTELASFDNSTRMGMSPEYPETEGTLLKKGSLSLGIAEVLFEECGITGINSSNTKIFADEIFSVLNILHTIHHRTVGTEKWNVSWIRTVEAGLKKLASTIIRTKSDQPEVTFTELATWIWPAFGLPQPLVGAKDDKKAKEIIDSLLNNWGNSDLATVSVHRLASHPGTIGDKHSLSGLDWSEYDRYIAQEPSIFSAFLAFIHKFDSAKALYNTSHDQFVNPDRKQKQIEPPYLANLDSGIVKALGDSINVIQTQVAEITSSDAIFESDMYEIVIPFESSSNIPDRADESLTASVIGKKVQWIHDSRRIVDDTIRLLGKFRINTAKSSHESFFPEQNLSLESTNAELNEFCNISAPIKILVFPPETDALALFSYNKKNLKKVLVAGSTCFDPMEKIFLDESPYSIDLPSASAKIEVLVQSFLEEPICNGVVMDPLENYYGLYTALVSVNGASTITVGSRNYDLLPPVRSDKHESPVVAAVEQAVATVPVPEAVSDSLCRQYEEFIISPKRNSVGFGKLGHVFLPEQETYEFGSFEESERTRVFTTRGLNEKLSRNPHLRVDPRMLESAELLRFTAAYEHLGVEAHCRHGDSTAETYSIPSKCSWRHLVSDNRSQIEEYLESYAALIRFAESLNCPFTRFWASYPFSYSIWDDSDSFLSCRAVFLSPLHPIRLQWIAEVEETLWQSSLGAQLMGTIEGWNLPITGSGESVNSRFVASPLDSGPGQLFIGWSMLVQVQTGRPEIPKTVSRSGKYVTPGSSVGGLNGQVTKSALRTFKRITPHLSTLVVDIASTTKAARLPELDVALLSTAREWIKDTISPLSGGIRVHDSSCRIGHPPIAELEKLIDDFPDVPVTWRRYDNSQSIAGVRTNVRILNDAASRISYSENDATAFGVLGKVPLKRLTVSAKSSNYGHQTDVYPLINYETGQSPFDRALATLESNGRGFVLHSLLSPEILESRSADWTIAGEAFTSPSALVNMLQSDGTAERMLWEWRPPFLASNGRRMDLAIQDRPYISISRISRLFRSDLERLLSKALGTDTCASQVESVLGTLGTRGIGLSTLLSVGGNQAAGAIGFYATLEMSRHFQYEADPTFILPLDSCDGFLQKLAGDPDSNEYTRRADLLVIRFTDEEIVISPIEIKCFGLAGDHGSVTLPDLEDAALADAKSQIESTSKLLTKLCARWDEISKLNNEADKNLWANSFASLLEAACKIQPLPAEVATIVRKRIQEVVDGDFRLAAGKGLITYYSRIDIAGHNNSIAKSGARSQYKITTNSNQSITLLSAETGYALTNVANESSMLCREWADLLRIATDIGDPVRDTPTIYDHECRVEPLDFREAEEETARDCHNSDSNPGEISADSQKSKSGDSEAPSSNEQRVTSDVNDGVRFEVGRLLDTIGESSAEYSPGDTRLNQMNIGIVGDLGTGKTQILRTIVSKVREESKKTQEESASFLIFDYKNDYQDEEFLNRVGGIVLDPENMPLNVFSRSISSRQNHRRTAMEFFDVISKIYKGVGPVQRQKFGEAAQNAFAGADGRDPTLGEVLENYMLEGKPDSVSSILSDFVHGNIFTEDHDAIQSFEDLMKESVVVVNLHSLGADQTMKNAIVVLFLNLYYDYMKKTQKVLPRAGASIPNVRTIASYLLVDEANNIMKYEFDVLQQLLLESREFGFGVILSSQFLSHFSGNGKNYAEPLNTWFIHKVPDVSAKQLSQLGLPHAENETADRIKTLDNHCSYYSSYGFRGRFIRDNSYFDLYNIKKG